MNLTPIPVTSIFNKARDPWFNHDAAEWVYETVMKMDADEAEMFTYLVAYEMLDADIQGNLRTFQKRLDEVVAKRFEQVKKAVVEVSKARGEVDDGFADAVQTLEEICKKDRDVKWDPNLHPRGNSENAGQFRRKIKHPLKEPLYDHHASALGIPKEINDLTDMETKKQAQAEYLQLADFLTNHKSIGDNNLDKILLTLERKNTGDTFTVPHTGGDLPKVADWNPESHKVVEVRAIPQTTTVGGAAFDLGRALGAPGPAAVAGSKGVATFDQKFPTFANEWVTPETPGNENDRRFKRVQSTAQFVGAFAPPGSHVANAAKLAELVGQHGPEAEKVIGPHMRKTAYRYRGTQKQPEAALVGTYNRAINNAKNSGEGGSLNQMVSRRAANLSRIPTWEERAAGRAEVVDYFRNPENGKMPSKRLYGLQLAAGNTPPSEGVIIDKNGKIVTQAVGYGDDHYLPFDLRSLKGLRGGEYIRTRSVGGPTAEDIYTGLATGARQVTVTSRSGTFTLQFDETFKGGRRYNDKAKRMTDRYEHLLDAVESEQIDNQPVPDEVRAMIEREVQQKYGSYPARERQHYLSQKIDEYKSFSGLDEHDQALIDTQIRTMPISDLTDRQVKNIRSDLVASRLAEKEFKFRLNGDGYDAALRALKEQFPYYIANIGYQPRREIEPEKDKGYVMPRHNRPVEAKHGYYNTRIAGVGTIKTIAGEKTGKIPASEANYQNHANHGRLEPVDVASTPTPSSGPESPGARGLSDEEKAAERAYNEVESDDFGKAAWDLMRSVTVTDPAKRDEMGSAYPSFAAAASGREEDFKRMMKDKSGRDDVRRFVQAHRDRGLSTEKITALESHDKWLDREMGSRDRVLATFPTKPFLFSGKAYSRVATATDVTDEMESQSRGVLPVSANKPYADMSPDEMRQEWEALDRLRKNRAQIGHNDDLLAAYRIHDVGNARTLLGMPDGIEGQMEKLQRIRALKVNGGRPNPPPVVGGGSLTPTDPPTDPPTPSAEELERMIRS